MRVRHRIPSIFNLSMVDLFCCALGCVILLWLVNLRQTKAYEEDASKQLDAAKRERETVNVRVAALEKERTALEKERDDLQEKYHALTLAAAELEDKRKEAARRVSTLESDLRASMQRIEDQRTRAEELAKKLDTAEGRIKELQVTADQVPGLKKDLKVARDEAEREIALAMALEKDLAARKKVLDATVKSLNETEAAKLALEKDLSGRDKELASVRGYKDKWEASERRVLALEKQLGDANRGIEELKAEAGRIRAIADNRFAGVALNGRRVVFLVDMSGSMRYLDEDTKAPQKWDEVCKTVGKVMRSLPDLEKFQVILFSDKVSYLLGQDGKWLDLEAGSADKVVKGLTNVRPEGGTNMHAAIQTAFRYRADGLDSIYLFSDGLPNMGEPLKPEELKRMKETEAGEILGKYIRKTLKSDWNREQRNQPRVRIHSIGFFYESPDVGAFLWALSRENDGSFVGMSKP
jgi:hypothetical protein